MAVIGVVCGWVIIRRCLSPELLTLRKALVPGFFVGFGLAVVTIEMSRESRPRGSMAGLRLSGAASRAAPSVLRQQGLVANADGSVDIFLQNAAPEGRESNWLPAPTGNFRLWLRAHMPGAAILDGTYTVPAVAEVK